MTLEPVDLDDLTWQDLVDLARDAIPAESNRRWTHHAPVDPGITVLELYGARLEERLYWLDRVPDDLVRALLRLLGADPPRPARPASTVLRFSGPPTTVPAGTVVRSPRGADQVELTTDDDLAVIGGAELRVVIGGVDRTSELGPAIVPSAIAGSLGAAGQASRAGVDLLPADGGPAEATLALRAATPPAEGAALAIALCLEPVGDLPPGWAEGARGGVAPPAVLQWSYRSGGRRVAIEPGRVVDGTGGLRRSGVVRLANPAAGWRAVAGGGFQLDLAVSTEAATFSAPPRLLGAWPNAVGARHRVRRHSGDESGSGETLAAQLAHWLPVPGLELEVPGAAERLLTGPDGTELVLVERDGRPWTWLPADDLAFAGPGDRVFVPDRRRGTLRFGDGRAGRIPVPGRDPSGGVTAPELTWTVGGGAIGNRGSELAWSADDRSLGELTVANVVPVAGGTDPETIDQARQRAGAELGRRHRAVVDDDHVDLVTDAELLGVAVARAQVCVGRHPAFPCNPIPGSVTVVVVPAVPLDPATGRSVVAAPRPDPGLLATVSARLDSARLLGAEVFVEGPTYRSVEVVVTLDGHEAALERARADVAAALAGHLDPLAGDGGAGWPFGGPVRPSDLLGVAQDSLAGRAGVARVEVGIDGGPPTIDCDDVALGDHELPHLVSVTVRTGARRSPTGGLR